MQALHQIYQLIQQLKSSFAMTETMPQPTLEEELRAVRQGRRGDFHDI